MKFLKENLSEMPDTITITKVHIEAVDKFGYPIRIEYEKPADELKVQKKRGIFNRVKFIKTSKK